MCIYIYIHIYIYIYIYMEDSVLRVRLEVATEQLAEATLRQNTQSFRVSDMYFV